MSAPDVEIQAWSSRRFLWLRPSPELDDEALALGWSAQGTPRFTRLNRGSHVGDLVWTGGSFSKVASPRFITVLNTIDATGFVDFEIEGPPDVAGYRGLGVTGVAGEHDLANPDGEPFWSLVLSARLDEALAAAGVTDFDRRLVG